MLQFNDIIVIISGNNNNSFTIFGYLIFFSTGSPELKFPEMYQIVFCIPATWVDVHHLYSGLQFTLSNYILCNIKSGDYWVLFPYQKTIYNQGPFTTY